MRNFLKSFRYAFRGLWHAVKGRTLKIQLLAALAVIVAGLYFRITSMEWCILLLTIAVVLAFEIVNTAVENLVDLVTLERKPLAGKIKDLAAGAVLLASIIAAVIGIVIFADYIR